MLLSTNVKVLFRSSLKRKGRQSLPRVRSCRQNPKACIVGSGCGVSKVRCCSSPIAPRCERCVWTLLDDDMSVALTKLAISPLLCTVCMLNIMVIWLLMIIDWYSRERRTHGCFYWSKILPSFYSLQFSAPIHHSVMSVTLSVCLDCLFPTDLYPRLSFM